MRLKHIFYIIVLSVIGYIIYNNLKKINYSENQSDVISQTNGSDVSQDSSSSEDIRYYTFKLDKPYRIAFKITQREVAQGESILERLKQTSLASLGLTGRESDLQLRVWHVIYQRSYHQTRPVIARLANVFKKLQKENNLNRIQLAYLVLKFIQHIPYLRPGGQFDFYTPPRTLYERGRGGKRVPPQGHSTGWHGAGDCDTKVVLQMIILSELGYRSIMYHSFRYSHAMIGIELQGVDGPYKEINGIRYLFTETTYPNWRIGQLPPQYSDPDFWVPLDIIGSYRQYAQSSSTPDRVSPQRREREQREGSGLDGDLEVEDNS